MNAVKNSDVLIPVMTIIGVGMIGGSMALGLKQRNQVGRVIGFGRSQENLAHAKSLDAIDDIATSVADAVAESDMVVLATPVGAMAEIMTEIKPALRADAIITDVGSVKQGIVDAARANLGEVLPRFVPAHPVAGKERSGVEASSAGLFENHRAVVVSLDESDADAVAKVEQMWRVLGSEIVRMDVAEHDRILAMTSHLPHLLAYTMVHYFGNDADLEKCYEMVAGGFYDFTRTASSDPVMWRDICEMNRDAILEKIQGYRSQLGQIESMVETGDLEALELIMTSARNIRAGVKDRRKIGVDDEPPAQIKQRITQQVNR